MNPSPIDRHSTFEPLTWSARALLACDTIPAGLCVVDQERRLVGMNRRLAEMLSCPLINQPEPVPYMVSQLEPHIRQVLQDGPVDNVEVRIPQSSGTDKVLLVSLESLRNSLGQIEGVLCLALDITERKRVEADLRESEQHYWHTIEFNPHILWIADPDGRAVEISPQGVAVSGLTKEAVIGDGWQQILHPDDRARVVAIWSETARSGHFFDIEYRLRVADGSYRWFRARAMPRRDSEGRILRWYGTLEDVHDYKLAEQALRDSEERAREQAALLEAIYKTAPVGLAFHDCELRYLAINDHLSAINGCPADQTLGRTPLDVFGPGLGDKIERLQRGVLESGVPIEALEMRNATLAEAGEERDFLASFHRVSDSTGAVLGISVVVLDITERKRAESALRDSEAFARSVLESSLDCIKVHDLEGRLLFMNGPGLALLEIDDFASIRGRPWLSLLPEAMAAKAARAFEAAKAGLSRRFTDLAPTVKGTLKWWDIGVTPIFGPDCEVVRILSVSRDISEKRAAEQQAAYLAYHDPLTELPNRRFFREKLEKALARRCEGEHVAVLHLDLDLFKSINDTLGSAIGDAVLQEAARRVETCIAGSALAARLGGDEFGVIQTMLPAPADVTAVAQCLVEALGKEYHINGQSALLGVSIGIAVAPDGGATADELIRNANVALHQAKADGRGRFRFFERGMNDAIREKQELKIQLRAALEQGELELHYQPLIALPGKQVSCLEALLRWRHPVRGLVYPGSFIPFAEETGSIAVIGEWALRSACLAASHWPASTRVAVNLSPVQLRDADFCAVVESALAQAGLAAERLELEITESVLLQEDETNLATLQRLQKLGVRIVLDDFGTGFASLAYLLRFPFSKIKIDRSFVVGLPHREDAQTLTRAIIGIGKSLGMSVAAEGVETEEQFEALSAMGCSEIQGYLIGRPVPAAEVNTCITRLHTPQLAQNS